MENEDAPANDHTDTQSQTGKKSDNGSRRSSRVGSSRSDRSKAISGPEATAIDEVVPRKTSSHASGSPRLDRGADEHPQNPVITKSKPTTPAAPMVDAFSRDMNDDGLDTEEPENEAEINEVVRIHLILVVLNNLFSFDFSSIIFIKSSVYLVLTNRCGPMKFTIGFVFSFPILKIV